MVLMSRVSGVWRASARWACFCLPVFLLAGCVSLPDDVARELSPAEQVSENHYALKEDSSGQVEAGKAAQ